MTGACFEVAFDEKPFEDDVIDVRDLAPSLLAFGNVGHPANRARNGERADASLEVAATGEGSLAAQLAVDVAWLPDILDATAANPDRVVAADRLMSLLLKVGAWPVRAASVRSRRRFLPGKKPDAVAHRGDGTSSITMNDTTIVVADETVQLLEDIPTREAVENVTRDRVDHRKPRRPAPRSRAPARSTGTGSDPRSAPG